MITKEILNSLSTMDSCETDCYFATMDSMMDYHNKMILYVEYYDGNIDELSSDLYMEASGNNGNKSIFQKIADKIKQIWEAIINFFTGNNKKNEQTNQNLKDIKQENPNAVKDLKNKLSSNGDGNDNTPSDQNNQSDDNVKSASDGSKFIPLAIGGSGLLAAGTMIALKVIKKQNPQTEAEEESLSAVLTDEQGNVLSQDDIQQSQETQQQGYSSDQVKSIISGLISDTGGTIVDIDDDFNITVNDENYPIRNQKVKEIVDRYKELYDIIQEYQKDTDNRLQSSGNDPNQGQNASIEYINKDSVDGEVGQKFTASFTKLAEAYDSYFNLYKEIPNVKSCSFEELMNYQNEYAKSLITIAKCSSVVLPYMYNALNTASVTVSRKANPNVEKLTQELNQTKAQLVQLQQSQSQNDNAQIQQLQTKISQLEDELQRTKNAANEHVTGLLNENQTLRNSLNDAFKKIQNYESQLQSQSKTLNQSGSVVSSVNTQVINALKSTNLDNPNMNAVKTPITIFEWYDKDKVWEAFGNGSGTFFNITGNAGGFEDMRLYDDSYRRSPLFGIGNQLYPNIFYYGRNDKMIDKEKQKILLYNDPGVLKSIYHELRNVNFTNNGCWIKILKPTQYHITDNGYIDDIEYGKAEITYER